MIKVITYVVTKLKEDWSPEIIAGRISIDCPGLSISHEAIYQYIYHPNTPNRHELINCLRRAHRRRKKKGIGRKERNTKIPNPIRVDVRPPSVDMRIRFGDWEGDSLVSRKSIAALNSLAERKSRLLLLTKLKRKGASETAQAVINRLMPFPQKALNTLEQIAWIELRINQRPRKCLGFKTPLEVATHYVALQS
jgi:IS30 family transposase